MTSQPDPSLSGIAGFPNIARMAARGSKLATLVSAFAFAFSAVSLYETVIKQAQLKVYVTNTLLYTRDPYVGSEVIAVPITISNSGAREGAVVTLELDVKQLDSGRTEMFSSTYTADAQYFGGHDDVTARIKRPKAPFAPLSIVGRSAYTGTILFYPKKDRETGQKPLIEGKSKIEMVLRVITLSPARLARSTFVYGAGADQVGRRSGWVLTRRALRG